MTPRRTLILVALLLAGSLAGCSRFTRQNYETIYVGQPAWDVERAMGRPTAIEGEEWVYLHEAAPYRRAVIRLVNGKVVGKSWSYERQGSGTEH